MKQKLVLLFLVMTLTLALAACGTNENSNSSSEASTENSPDQTTGQGTEANTNEQEKSLSKVKMIQLGTNKVMRYAELYNTADEEGFKTWYNGIFSTQEYYDALWENSPKGTAQLVGVSPKDVEVEEVDATSFKFQVVLTLEVKNAETEEITITTEKIDATLTKDDAGDYKIQTFTTETVE